MAHPSANPERQQPTCWQPCNSASTQNVPFGPQIKETLLPSNFVASNLLKKISRIIASNTNLRQNSPNSTFSQKRNFPRSSENEEWITELRNEDESSKKKKVVDVLDVQIFSPNKTEDRSVFIDKKSIIDCVVDSSFEEMGEDWADLYVEEDKSEETEEPIEEKIEVSEIFLQETKDEKEVVVIESDNETIVISEDEDYQPNKPKRTQCFKCPHCTYETLRSGALTVHLKHAHKVTSDWFKCGFCKYTAVTQDLISIHTKCHGTASARFYCKCSFSTANQSRFFLHMERKHKIAVKWFHCNICAHKSPSSSDLKEHEKNHNLVQVLYNF